MKVLLACSDNSYWSWEDNKRVGRLITPQLLTQDAKRSCSVFGAVDNCAYTCWSGPAFTTMIRDYRDWAKLFKWVASPDIVGDWRGTVERFAKWGKIIAGYGYKLAFVLQDGQEEDHVPWNDITTVFLGGSTEYKLSDEAKKLCLLAREKGKLVHVGRVNSIKRAKMFIGVADTIDGLTFSKYSRTYLPKFLKWLETVQP